VRRYLDVIRTPGAARLLVAGVAARLPYGMSVLALLLLLRGEGFGYGEAGLVVGGQALAVAVTAPFLGRLVDRLGPTRVLLATAALSAVAWPGLTAAALGGAGLVAVLALSLLAGAGNPPVSPTLRALWPRLLDREDLDTALALDALQLELFFIVGPLLTAAIVLVASPAAAVLTAAALLVTGATTFALAPAARRWRPSGAVVRKGGLLADKGIRVLVLSMAVAEIAFGALEVGVAAFAEREASRAAAGPLLTVWAVGSLAGGLWYGARNWRVGADVRYLAVSALLVAGLLPLPLAWSMPSMAVLVAVAGLGLAPATAAAYSLVGRLAPEGSVAEAYSWQIVAYTAGASVGAWAGGALVDGPGVAAALALAPVAAAAGFLIAWTGRRELRGGAPTPQGDAPTAAEKAV